MRWRGEYGLVEHILPITSKLALGDDCGLESVRAPAVTNGYHFIAGRARGKRARFERVHVESAEGLDQPKTGYLVVG